MIAKVFFSCLVLSFFYDTTYGAAQEKRREKRKEQESSSEELALQRSAKKFLLETIQEAHQKDTDNLRNLPEKARGKREREDQVEADRELRVLIERLSLYIPDIEAPSDAHPAVPLTPRSKGTESVWFGKKN